MFSLLPLCVTHSLYALLSALRVANAWQTPPVESQARFSNDRVDKTWSQVQSHLALCSHADGLYA